MSSEVKSTTSTRPGATSMTDRYENIRKALAMGPTQGHRKWWEHEDFGYCSVNPLDGGLLIAKCDVRDPFDQEQRANAALIAACDPDTIRELLAENEALSASVENHQLHMLGMARDRDQLRAELAALAAELARWERSYREVHEPALQEAHAYIQDLRAELAAAPTPNQQAEPVQQQACHATPVVGATQNVPCLLGSRT